LTNNRCKRLERNLHVERSLHKPSGGEKTFTTFMWRETFTSLQVERSLHKPSGGEKPSQPSCGENPSRAFRWRETFTTFMWREAFTSLQVERRLHKPSGGEKTSQAFRWREDFTSLQVDRSLNKLCKNEVTRRFILDQIICCGNVSENNPLGTDFSSMSSFDLNLVELSTNVNST
jgi:hypothetical protein